MTTPAFGFSVSDFISALNLINKVRKSLKDAGGAAREYQSAVIELEDLEVTLSHLEALQPNEDDGQYINAIRAMVMACKLPLQEFMRKMNRFESSLGPFASWNSLRTVGEKANGSVTFAEDVENLRALVAAKHVRISLLLGMHTSNTLSRMSVEIRNSAQGLDKKILEHGAILQSVQERIQSMDDRPKLAQTISDEKLDSVGAKLDRTDSSVVQTACLNCSSPGHQLEDCQYLKSPVSSPHVNVGFWTGRRSISRAASVRSQRLGGNSSLHGSGRVDPEAKDLSFPDNHLRRSSARFSDTSASFSPPQMHIKTKKISATNVGEANTDLARKPLRHSCDICGQGTEVLRRRDWQTHVLQDLRPYMCTVEHCDESTSEFESRKSWPFHEIRQHAYNPYKDYSIEFDQELSEDAACICIFCVEQTGGKNNSREKHVGRHMEEIAFSVVNKPYEESDFCSDSSETLGSVHDDIDRPYDKKPETRYGTGTESSRQGRSSEYEPLSARRDPLYQMKPREDGFYQYIFDQDGETCKHEPFKLKCNYE